VTIKQMFGPDRDLYVPQSGSGVAQFTPVGRAVGPFGSYGGGARAPQSQNDRLTLSLPVFTSRTFNNNAREKLRWALANALTQFNLGMSPDNVIISSVEDNPFDIRPDGTRAGIFVSYFLDVPESSTVNNITRQLTSLESGTIGGQLGYYLASLGVVPLKDYRKVAPGKLCAFNCFPTGLSGGEIFIIIVAVFLMLTGVGYIVHLKVLAPKGIKVPFVPSPASIAAACACCSVSGMRARATKLRGTGRGGDDDDGPQRKSSRVDTMNPLGELVSAGDDTGAASTGSRQSRVVNILNSVNSSISAAIKTTTAAATGAATGATAAAAPAPAAAQASAPVPAPVVVEQVPLPPAPEIMAPPSTTVISALNAASQPAEAAVSVPAAVTELPPAASFLPPPAAPNALPPTAVAPPRPAFGLPPPPPGNPTV
jgi:hypothetical protein